MKTGIFPLPLFDKLTADDDAPLFYTKDEWVKAIERDISQLLNTRQSSEVSTYGLPDFHEAANSSQWVTIAQNCKNAIRQFESRLTRVQVNIEHFDRHKNELYLNIQGVAHAGDTENFLHFTTRLATY